MKDSRQQEIRPSAEEEKLQVKHQSTLGLLMPELLYRTTVDVRLPDDLGLQTLVCELI
jgi:hypothetical protein